MRQPRVPRDFEDVGAVLVDAQKMAKKNPDTFNTPTRAELAALDKGMFVKVCI